MLRRRLRQQRFDSPAHEALLNVLVASDFLRRRTGEVCAAYGISPGQYNVLRILGGAQPGGLTRGDVAARLIEHAPDVTRLIDRLVRAALVRRGVSGEDGRRSIAAITPAGLRLLQRMRPAVDGVTADVAQRLGPAGSRKLSALCERIYTPGGDNAR
jgi:DNA-binding MarR family transcriptional regulator